MKNRLIGTLLSAFVALPGMAFAQDLTATDAGRRAATPRTDKPTQGTLHRAGSSDIDLRKLPKGTPQKFERLEFEEPGYQPIELPGAPPLHGPLPVPGPSAPAPAPAFSIDGLDYVNFGTGHPPDTNGDVGPTYYIQTINTAVGIYRKSDGVRVAAFGFNALMSQGNFGNLCDTNNFGDPVVLYDSFEDRWVLTDFAFQIDGFGSVVFPPGAFQCFAVSKTGDPVAGGWNFYWINTANGLGDYPKFGIWPDGIYMSVNVFAYPGAFESPRVYAFNKAQMYAGGPTVQVVSFDAPSTDFTLLPANARLQTGTPPAGTPNFFVSTSQFVNAIGVYKLHVDWDRVALSTFAGPDAPLAATSWPDADVPDAPSLGGNLLDVLEIRAMAQNQYTNIGGVESLWTAHTVRRADVNGFAAPRWYQADVTGGSVAANLLQAATWDPDSSNVTYRFTPSVALDRVGDLAMGYSTSSSTTKPAIKYAGRLAGDPLNTFGQTEQLLTQGAGTQTGNCGSSTCIRWGDYSAMTLDPDGCRFWMTNLYYAVDGLSFLTRIGSFGYPGCAPLGGGGTVSGTVTFAVGGAPVSGAIVALGSRSTTTDNAGNYAFNAVPAGTYPALSAAFSGCISAASNGVAVTDGNTTTEDFSLAAAPGSGCFTDTLQADFQLGTGTNTDLAASADAVVLAKPSLDQSNVQVSNSGFAFSSTAWAGQTFTAGVSGQLTRIDADLFCSGCTGTTPNLTVSIRATNASGVPTGADLASATLTGFSGSGFFPVTFASPATITAGTKYAIVLRATANPSAGSYAYVCSCAGATSGENMNAYAGGQRVTSPNSGTTWSLDTTAGGRDLGFHVYVNSGYAGSGDLVSSLKDANPAPGESPNWTTLSWTAMTPANTSVKFQVAASNSNVGPFNFVGPDHTAATFFTTSGASLSQFEGKRFLRYRAYLATSNGAVTPTVSDVTACFVDALPANLSINVDDGVSTATPGNQVTYTITAANAGPGVASGATVSDTFPATETCSWSCAATGTGSCAPSGSGAISDTINLGVGDTAIYTAICSIAASATGTLSDTATIAPPAGVLDPNPVDSTSTDTDTLTPKADLQISKTDGVLTAVPGAAVVYTITATNNGPSDAPGTAVADTFPAIETCTWTCSPGDNATCAASGNGSINDHISLPVGGTATYTANCAIAADATGMLSNTATVTAPAGVSDMTPGNNSATDTDTLDPAADLKVTNTDGVTSAVAGGSVTYTITASNPNGPSDAPGATVADTFPASETCSWTCAMAGGATCTASGSGPINDTVGLPKGGSATYTASCTIDAAATGTLSNTATVTAPGDVPDANTANNQATDEDTLTIQANIGVTVDDSRAFAQVGDSLDYVLHVTNAGPSNASATVHDALPAELAGGSWTCSGSTDVVCHDGTGNTLDDSAALPSGGSADYLYSATLQTDNATDSVANSASVSLAAGTDPVPGNNTDTDTDIIVVFRDKFEGSSENLSHFVDTGGGLSVADLSIDGGLLNTLGVVPVTVASGRSAGGKLLFDIELVRFGTAIALRTVTRDHAGMSRRTSWRFTDTNDRLVSFAWQAAQGAGAGYLVVHGGAAALQVVGHREQDRLTYLVVRVENAVPWLVLLAR